MIQVQYTILFKKKKSNIKTKLPRFCTVRKIYISLIKMFEDAAVCFVGNLWGAFDSAGGEGRLDGF